MVESNKVQSVRLVEAKILKSGPLSPEMESLNWPLPNSEGLRVGCIGTRTLTTNEREEL